MKYNQSLAEAMCKEGTTEFPLAGPKESWKVKNLLYTHTVITVPQGKAGFLVWVLQAPETAVPSI